MLSCRGGGKLSRAVYLAPNPPGYQSKIILLILLILNLSEYQYVSIKNIIQVKFSCFLSGIVSYAKLQEWGQAAQGGLSSLHPPGYQSKIILLILHILNYLNVEM